MRKWKKHWFEYVVSSDESDLCSDSLYVLKTFQHIWADFQMNTTKNIVKEQSNIICMCQHTAQPTIYLEIFNKNENDFFRTNRSCDYHDLRCCIDCTYSKDNRMCKNASLRNAVILLLFVAKIKMDEKTRRIKRHRALTEYQTWCERIVNLFCKIYFWNCKNRDRCEYLAWYMKRTIVVNEKYYFHIADIRVALTYDISSEILFDRYKYIEEANENNETHLTLKDYFFERNQKKKFIS